MEPRVGVVGRIFFVRWYGAGTTEHIRLVTDAMFAARREGGQPLVFGALIPADLAIPDAATRREIVRLTPLVDHLCESYFIALRGEGTARQLMRSALEIPGMLMRKPFTIVATIDELVAGSARAARLDPAEVLDGARALGIAYDEDAAPSADADGRDALTSRSTAC